MKRGRKQGLGPAPRLKQVSAEEFSWHPAPNRLREIEYASTECDWYFLPVYQLTHVQQVAHRP